MLRLAILFFVIALIAMIFNAYFVAGVSLEIARLLLLVFVVLAILFAVGHFLRGERPRDLI